MTARVVTVQPVIDQQTGQQRTWAGQGGATNYVFMYTLDNGMRGEVSHQAPVPRFPVGSEVEAKDATNPQYPQYPKMKLDTPGQQGGFRGGKGGGGSTWTPEKEASVMIQGLLKSIIQSGVIPSQWDPLLAQAITTHDTHWKARVKMITEQVAKRAAAAQGQVVHPAGHALGGPPSLTPAPQPYVHPYVQPHPGQIPDSPGQEPLPF